MVGVPLSPVVSLLLKKLDGYIGKKISFLRGFQGKLKSLKQTILTIEAVLVTVEMSTKKTERVITWLQNLKDVVYDVEDLLDDISTEDSRRKAGRKLGKLWYYFQRPLNPLSYSETIKEIEDKLAGITGGMEMFQVLRQSVPAEKEDVASKIDKLTDPTDSSINLSGVIGRVDEKEEVVGYLLEEGNFKVSSISIAGIGGLGKTTLAKMVCNDERVKKKYELRWAHVSFKKFNLGKIVSEILGMTKVKYTHEKLLNILQEQLRNKTCLFVLDDVWDMELVQWDGPSGLKNLLLNLNGDSNGNRVLITTRNQRIARMSEHSLQLKPLSPLDCWPLFEKFAAFDKDKHPNLLPIGKEIIRKCEGVPLAAITLGLMLELETEEEEWCNVYENEVWSLTFPKDGNIMSTLKLSYDNLEPIVRSCFAYYAICDNQIDMERLTQLWIAQGFIEQTSSEQKVFKKLVSMSFFDNVEEDVYCQVTRFRGLRLFCNLALLVSTEYSCIRNSKIRIISPGTRHISLGNQLLEDQDSELPELKRLRTFVGPSDISLLSNFKRLRVLDLSHSEFEKLPSTVSNLKHLRYLDLSRNQHLKELPTSIGDLHNLQTLRVDKCKELKKMPDDIQKLINLKNLYIGSQQAFLQFKKISSLRTLHLEGFDHLVRLPEMPDVTALETLEMFNCPKLCFSDYDMKHLKCLQRLTIVNLPKVVSIPAGLQFADQKLTSICLSNCWGLTQLPEWFKSLTCLQRLAVKDCPSLKSLADENDGKILPDDLRVLHIEDCPELTKRCKREEGEDWPKINHVKEIYLDRVKIHPLPGFEASNLASSSTGQAENRPKLKNAKVIPDNKSSSFAASGVECPKLAGCKMETSKHLPKINHYQNNDEIQTVCNSEVF